MVCLRSSFSAPAIPSLTSTMSCSGLTWSSNLLVNVTPPDGALVTLTYGQDMFMHQRISTLSEAGSRRIATIMDNMSTDLVQITDPDNSARTFVYDGSNRLINDHWRPLNATFTYDR